MIKLTFTTKNKIVNGRAVTCYYVNNKLVKMTMVGV
jgi:hypothetical protein